MEGAKKIAKKIPIKSSNILHDNTTEIDPSIELSLLLDEKNGVKGAKRSQKEPLKSPIQFICEKCDYITAKKSEFLRHESTQKHRLLALNANANSEELKIQEKYMCDLCNKNFSKSGNLSRHKKICKPLNVDKETSNPTSIMEMFMEFMKQNKELQNTLIEQNREHNKQLIELTRGQSINNINSNNTNTTNQQFNIQFFLNETCKDAMNLTDFVNSLQLQVEDFEATGKLGYVEGISRIIINGLKRVDTTKRPIHCTDMKRETLYIKQDNTWEKEDNSKENLKRAVNQVARMNLSQLPKWQRENPESEILDTKENEDYIRYSMAALGGKGEEEEEKFLDKIVKNVIKEVAIPGNLRFQKVSTTLSGEPDTSNDVINNK
jgi:hypothetical protein